MHDMRHYLPEYLRNIYRQTRRGEDDLLVQICKSFQKSMYCVTTATILGLMPHSRKYYRTFRAKSKSRLFEKLGWIGLSIRSCKQ